MIMHGDADQRRPASWSRILLLGCDAIGTEYEAARRQRLRGKGSAERRVL
jgi:hypothetical protein